jgi:hypothetical protein
MRTETRASRFTKVLFYGGMGAGWRAIESAISRGAPLYNTASSLIQHLPTCASARTPFSIHT